MKLVDKKIVIEGLKAGLYKFTLKPQEIAIKIYVIEGEQIKSMN